VGFKRVVEILDEAVGEGQYLPRFSVDDSAESQIVYMSPN
jgi:hypothetical protein